MGVVSAADLATPFHPEPYPAVAPRVPVLRSFYLGYDVGDATPGDHQILHMQVMVGGGSHDLSPLVNFPPANIPDGRLNVALQDADASDDEFFYRVSHSTLSLPGVRRYQIRQAGNVGEATRKLPHEIFPNGGVHQPPLGKPVLALVGFRLFFGLNRNHELDRVGIWFRDDELHTVLQDQNVNPASDDYSFLVDFVVIPVGPGMTVSRGIERGTATGGERVHFPTPSRAHFLLTGWALNFKNGDHEIREIGVDRQGDDFVVFYADKNADDPFDWRVEWAHIGKQVVSSN
jgi:hypothetical protein